VTKKLSLEDFLLPPEQVAEIERQATLATDKPKKSRTRTRLKFTIFPDIWDQALAGVDADGCTYRVAIYLLKEVWRSKSNRVKLANVLLAERNVSRWQKYHALEQLARAGLIAIGQEPRKSPIITVRFTG
jgi:hypothetical protein